MAARNRTFGTFVSGTLTAAVGAYALVKSIPLLGVPLLVAGALLLLVGISDLRSRRL